MGWKDGEQWRSSRAGSDRMAAAAIAVGTKEAAGSDSRDEGAFSRMYHSGRFFPAGHDAAPGQFGHHLFRKDR